jgi:hypothetical protein
MRVTMTEEMKDQETTEVVEAQASEAADDSSSKEEEKEPEKKEPVPDAYAPNYKYKVYDKEKEFPESVRPVIKSKADEDYFRDLYTKADGVEEVKGKLEKYRKSYEEVEPKYNELKSKVDKLQYFAKNDLDTYLEISGVPESVLFDHVSRKLKLQENPEEARAYNESRQASRRAFDLEQNNRSMDQELALLKAQQHQTELHLALTNPDYSSFEKDFDSRLGPGAFRQEVDKYGNYVLAAEKRYISPLEAVQTVHNRYKPLIQMSATPTQQQGAAAITHTSNEKSAPPVIPNVGSGRSASPVKKKPTSTDELRKMAKKFEGEDDEAY